MYPVRNVARARQFYEETLGLTAGLTGNKGDQWWIEYDLPGGGCVALTNFIPDEPSAAAGGTIAFEVEDLDALIADLKSKGAPPYRIVRFQPRLAKAMSASASIPW